MTELETSRHLYQPPHYRARDGSWHSTWAAAVGRSGPRLTLEPGAVLSLLSFHYVCGDLTMLREIRRRPWLSSIGPEGDPVLETIPPHGLARPRIETIAQELHGRLREEMARACAGRSRLIVLLSGGLDSRVIAGTLAALAREGRLAAAPVALTWGLPDSRDVAYGREAARLLGFEWQHLPLEPQHALENIDDCVRLLGALVSPVHLHRLTWFRSVPRDALVLAGNYGDMVGRAEFSGKRLLELDGLRPSNAFGLLRADVLESAREALETELAALRQRAPGRPLYETCEHEMHGHYTRGLIAHAMSTIRHFCDVYQMFTDPDVYGYMWSLHPSLRFDDVYALLLDRLHPGLARLPWARTNRALRGPTRGAGAALRRDFHDYPAWISGEIHAVLAKEVEAEWFAATGLFDREGVRRLASLVREGPQGPARLYGSDPFELFAWLVSFRRLVGWLESQGASVSLEPGAVRPAAVGSNLPTDDAGRVRRRLRSSPLLHQVVRSVRQRWLRVESRLRYRARR